MNCKLHLFGPDFYTLDSTRSSGDRAYCAASGSRTADRCARCGPRTARSACPARPGGWATPRTRAGPGPTWTVGGQYCTGQASGCENHPTNQYALLVYAPGTYQVCANTGSCCTVEVER